jgi:hypothetical protein
MSDFAEYGDMDALELAQRVRRRELAARERHRPTRFAERMANAAKRTA